MITGTRVTARFGEQSYTLHLDAAAYSDMSMDYHPMYILSAAGPATSVRAVSSLLQSNSARGDFLCYEAWEGGQRRLDKGEGRWNVFRHKIGLDTWHMLAVNDHANLLPVETDESVWQMLMSDAYTTPLLRSWAPWLVAELRERGHLAPLACYNCEAAMLHLTQEKLDELVSQGIRQGQLRLAA